MVISAAIIQLMVALGSKLLVGLRIAVLSLSAAYWLVKRANATPFRKRLGREGSANKLDFQG